VPTHRRIAIQRRIRGQQVEIERLRAALQFAMDKCVSENAGNTNAPFAYLYRDDWLEFKRMIGITDD
jgi:hypothetical protein